MFRTRFSPIVCVLAILAASAIPAEANSGPFVYVIPTASSDTTCTHFASTSGTNYAVNITGVHNPHDITLADAFYETSDGGITWSAIPSQFGLTINGVRPATPSFSLAHTYTVVVAGNGSPICFHFLSGNYDDNVGALVVKVDL